MNRLPRSLSDRPALAQSDSNDKSLDWPNGPFRLSSFCRGELWALAHRVFRGSRNVVLAQDETDLLLFPPLRFCWSPVGEPKEVVLCCRNAGRVVFGAMSLDEQMDRFIRHLDRISRSGVAVRGQLPRIFTRRCSSYEVGYLIVIGSNSGDSGCVRFVWHACRRGGPTPDVWRNFP